jgi:PleD family two-component response regulator|tara:strand:- start:4933 stop:5910 length:978 start_codon:yes stop_codon:yes gene_type:complete
MKILAVDDDPYILEILTMMAARAGFTDVSTSLSGEIALDMLNKGDVVFDCLLLDISMPDMDGIELCQLVRSMPAYRKTPVIMLTAMTEKDYIDRAFQAGATDYANKPFDIVELNARLRMAQEVFSVRQEAAAAISTVDAHRPEAANQHEFDIYDEVQIEGVKDLIEYTALGNYLTQLSRAGLVSLQVFAVKIDRIEAIYARASTEEFLYALTEVADAIGDVLRSSGYMMAYAGNGAFVVVSNKATLEPSVGLETEIQDVLDEKNSEYDDSAPLDIEVSIGNPIRPNTSKTQRIRKTFDRVIARAENRVLKKRSEPRPVNIRLVGR